MDDRNLKATAFALIAMSLVASLAQAQPAGSASLQVSVRDSQDHPLPAAKITLQGKSGEPNTENLAAIPPGTYTLHVSMPGYNDSAVGPFVLAAGEKKKLDVTLQPAFFDEPSFVVAGVTDGSARGGHGSDTVLRSTESLAKDAAALRHESAAVVPRDSSDAERRHALADAEEKADKPLDAVHDYQRAAELDSSERNLFDWGAELLAHRAPQPAIEVFAKAHRLFPRSVRTLLGLAAAYYAQGDYDHAAQWFFEASDLDPGDPTPYLFLAKVQAIEIKQLEGYAERLRRFAQLHPDNALANYYYAVSLWARRNPEDSRTPVEVRELLEKAIRLDPKLAAADVQLGSVYADAKDYAKAIVAYRQAIAIAPRMEEAHYRLAQIYGHTGATAEAQGELAIYNELSKESARQVERERSEMQRFVYDLRGGSTTAPPRNPTK